MKSLIAFIKASGLVALGVGALIIGPIIGILTIVIFLIWIIALIIIDHQKDMAGLKYQEPTPQQKQHH